MYIKIPEYVEEIEKEVKDIKDDTLYKIDMILCRLFNITLEEYKIIRSWCS